MTVDHRPVQHQCQFRFYGQLNDFLNRERRHRCFDYCFTRSPALIDAIQALGIPHPEVKRIQADGNSADFNQLLHGGERISVYPHFLTPDFADANQLGASSLSEPRFILDVHLGTLSRHLRLLGFDSVYGNDFEDSYIIDRALAEQRLILTRDLGILKQLRVKHGYFVRSSDPSRQIEELLELVDLAHQCRPLSRCINCNGLLAKVDKEKIARQLPAATRDNYQQFFQCRDCQQLYWRGSHYAGLMAKLAQHGIKADSNHR